MTEAQLYEALGRKQTAYDTLRLEYGRLLTLLGQVCAGDVAPERVQVDLAGLTWLLAEAAPTAPATEEAV